MIARRGFTTAALVVVPGLIAAQTSSPRRRVAVLRWDGEATGATAVAAFRERMAELGWIEGRTVEILAGFAGFDAARAGAFVEAAIAGGAEVIVASSTPATAAALRVTRSLPIVMAPAADPVANGFVSSLNRPGGNVTGITIGGPELAAKRLEILREVLPGVRRVAFLGSSRDPAAAGFVAASAEAARALGIELRALLIADAAELAGAFAALAAEGQEAVLVQPIFVFQRDEVAALALRLRLPTISELDVFAHAGVLMTYGASGGVLLRFGATHVDRILKGAKPAELPVEFPARVELTVNLRTARALGLDLPAAVLARADEVIE